MFRLALGVVLAGFLVLNYSALLLGFHYSAYTMDVLFIQAVPGLIVLGIPSALLILFGQRAIKKERLVIRKSVELIREDGTISVNRVAADTGVPAGQVRTLLLKLQRSGTLPLKAKIE